MRCVMEPQTEKAWLDISILQCPYCGRFYADASWYVVELGAEIECGVCHNSFNTRKAIKDRVLLEFTLMGGLVMDVKIAEHIGPQR